MKNNKHFTNTVIALTTSSVVLSSCDGYFIDNDLVDSNSLSDIGESAISINFSKADAEYLDLLNKLGNDILQHPSIANEFAINPENYMKKHGYYGSIDLDENMMRLVLALGNDQINEAIKKHDIMEAVRLMEEKGLLTNTYTRLSLTKKQVEEINKIMGIKNTTTKVGVDDIDQQMFVVGIAIVYVIAAVISQAAVAYNVAAAINAAVWLNVAVKSNVKTSREIDIAYTSNLIENNYVLKVFDLRGMANDTYIAADQYVNNQVDKSLIFIKEKHPEVLQNIPEETLKNYLKLLLLK